VRCLRKNPSGSIQRKIIFSWVWLGSVIVAVGLYVSGIGQRFYLLPSFAFLVMGVIGLRVLRVTGAQRRLLPAHVPIVLLCGVSPVMSIMHVHLNEYIDKLAVGAILIMLSIIAITSNRIWTETR
jgi:membrane protein YdbS with pleckstrin-like domain